MTITHSVYGLGVRVNVPIAGLAGLQPAERIDVSLEVGSLPYHLASAAAPSSRDVYVSDDIGDDGLPGVRISTILDGAYFRIAYADGTVIVVDAGGKAIWAHGPESATIEDTAAYLLGPTLGFVLCLRGVTCLHASAVVIDGKAVAFVGPAGAGKSSLAAAFARAGHAVLTDDVAPLNENAHGFDVRPAYPRVRLWPDSVESLFGQPDALPRITPGWEKRYLGLSGKYSFHGQPLTLSAIYLLGERESDGTAPRLASLPPRRAMMSLVSNTYAARLLDRSQRALEFDLLGRLVARVPVRQLTPHGDFTKIAETYSLVVEDVQRMRIATPAAPDG